MSGDDDDSSLIDFYPYRARFKTYERLEPDGRDQRSILAYLALGALAVVAAAGVPVALRLPGRRLP